MMRITISGPRLGTASRSLLVLLLLLLAGAALIVLHSPVPSAAQPRQPDGLQERRDTYYLTDADHPGYDALTACAEGYHMASFWELYDMSNLSYAGDHPDAHTKADMGSGPPANWYGWVRTGWASSVTNSAGTANCANWTSTSSVEYGSIVRLSGGWTADPSAIAPWEATTWHCDGVAPVWCVADPVYDVFLPLMLN